MSSWTFPHDEYAIPGDGELAARLLDLEVWVPGARVYVAEDWGGWPDMAEPLCRRAGEGDQDAVQILARVQLVLVRVPLHGSWLVADILEVMAVDVAEYATKWDPRRHCSPYLAAVGCDPVADPLFSPLTPVSEAKASPRMAALGWTVADELVKRGLLKAAARDAMALHQLVGGGLAATRPSIVSVWPAGRGKTMGSIFAALTRPGGTLAVVLNAVRGSWVEEIRRWTTAEPHEIRAAGERPAGDEGLTRYLQSCATFGQDPFVLVHMESLALHLAEVQGTGTWGKKFRASRVRFNPTTFILDEIQKAASPSWWEQMPTEVGGVELALKRTKGSTADNERMARSGAIYTVAAADSLRLRIELSASPMHNGRPRRLYGPLTFLSDRSRGPGEWGRYGKAYAAWFCGGQVNKGGFPDDKGASNVEELRDRVGFVLHEVTLAECSEGMPATRFEVDWIEEADLAPATGNVGKVLSALAKARARGRDVALEYLERAGVEAEVEDTGLQAVIAGGVWLRLAEASARKTPRAMVDVATAFRSKQKIVLFTSLRPDCERLAVAVQSTLLKEAKDVGSPLMEATGVDRDWARAVPVESYLRWGHGGTSIAEREAARLWFRDHPGPCVLVGTGQAWGTGVDGFQSADLALILMATFEVSDLVVQWRGRFDRYGETARPTLVKVLMGRGTYDEKLMRALADQVGPIQTLLDAPEFDGVEAQLRRKGDPAVIKGRVLEALSVGLFGDGANFGWSG